MNSAMCENKKKKDFCTVLMVFIVSVGKCDNHSIAELRLKGERDTVTFDQAQNSFSQGGK